MNRRRWEAPGALVALVLWGGMAGGEDLAAFLEPYQTPKMRGETGTVGGMAFNEPRSPWSAAVPLGGVRIVLLPPVPRLVAELETVKARARDSTARFLGAVGELRKIQAAHEEALTQAGGSGLVFTAVTGNDGGFQLSPVPAGEWVLFARHEVLHPVVARKIPKHERAARLFLLEPALTGYRTVTHWLVTVKVAAGGETRVELHDRNPWLTGVEEEKRP